MPCIKESLTVVSKFLSVSEGNVSSKRIFVPKLSGPNAQTDREDNIS